MKFEIVSQGRMPLGCGAFAPYAFSETLPAGEYAENALRFGVFCNAEQEKGYVLTHDVSLTRIALPYAFPAIVSRVSCGDEAYYIAFVGDYYATSRELRTAVRQPCEGGFFIGLANDAFALSDAKEIGAKAHVAVFPAEKNSFLRVIYRCAELYYSLHPYSSAGRAPVFGATNYTDAARGLKENLMDARATMHDGVGVYNPYAYHEDDVYTEAFAALDVAKGMYRYARTHGDKEAEAHILSVIDRIAADGGEYKWIDDVHNTQGFFHHVWGALPQGAALVNGDAARKGRFSDFDAFEEGANLFSTFKYYDRVFHLGELALLSGREEYKAAFLKLLPFVNSLRLSDYGQPVTYDLDTHEPRTGKEEGGSAGGAALWAEIHFLAAKLTGERHWLDEGLKGLEACNRLDYCNMYSMRTSPKPIAIGWCVRANLDAYRLTGEKKYLARMREVAGGIFAHYYLDTHPHTFFAANGFGYACACERWEAFLEMAESLWLMSGALPLLGDAALCRLYADAANTYLWALPINAQPYGNLAAGYDSIGAEYVPYEYSTGHQGDNPKEWGGDQSCNRQTKEIYGSGELFLFEEMLEGRARCFDPRVLFLRTDCADLYGGGEMCFCVYAAADVRFVPVAFALPAGRYRVECAGFSAEYGALRLGRGIALPVPPQNPSVLAVRRIGEETAMPAETLALDCTCSCDYETLRLRCAGGQEVYALFVDGKRVQMNTDGVFETAVCRERRVRVRAEGYSGNGVAVFETELTPFVKTFLFRSHFDGQDIACRNLTAKIDSHCYMFYADDADKRCGSVRFEGVGGGIFSLKIGALNAGTRLRVLLAEGERKTVLTDDLVKAGLYEYDLRAAERGAALEICSEGKTIGFLVNGADSWLPADGEAPAWRFDGCGGREWQAEFSPDLPFIEFVAEPSDGGEVHFFFDGEELFTPAEKAYPRRVYRKNRNVYKFPVPSAGMHTVSVRFTGGGRLRSARLTAERNYPYRHLWF